MKDSRPHRLCRQRVSGSGKRCRFHIGKPHGGPELQQLLWLGVQNDLPTAPADPLPIPTPRGPRRQIRRAHPDNLTLREQDLVEEVVAFCFDARLDGWQEAVVSRVVGNSITEKTWNRLFGDQRERNCKALADAAKAIIEGKEKLHEYVGLLAGRLVTLAGGGDLESVVVRELAKRIPIPAVDQKVIAVARGMQIVGILVCLERSIPLRHCQSFIDLALVETKEQVRRILIGALDDWTNPSPEMIAAWTSKTTAS